LNVARDRVEITSLYIEGNVEIRRDSFTVNDVRSRRDVHIGHIPQTYMFAAGRFDLQVAHGRHRLDDMVDIACRLEVRAGADASGRRFGIGTAGQLPRNERVEIRADRGAMIAIELVQNGDAAQPDAELTKALVGMAPQKGLILLSCGVNSNVIRLLPPLTISDEMLDEGLAILADCLESLLK